MKKHRTSNRFVEGIYISGDPGHGDITVRNSLYFKLESLPGGGQTISFLHTGISKIRFSLFVLFWNLMVFLVYFFLITNHDRIMQSLGMIIFSLLICLAAGAFGLYMTWKALFLIFGNARLLLRSDSVSFVEKIFWFRFKTRSIPLEELESVEIVNRFVKRTFHVLQIRGRRTMIVIGENLPLDTIPMAAYTYLKERIDAHRSACGLS